MASNELAINQAKKVMKHKTTVKSNQGDFSTESHHVSKPAVLSNTPVDPLVQLQRTLGNQAFGNFIQAKLLINEPGDVYEQEADRVTEIVMRMPDSQVADISKGGEQLQRKCAAGASGGELCPQCAEEELEIQRKPLARAATITPLIERASKTGEEEEDEFLQTKEAAGHTPELAPHLQSYVNSLQGSGQPLSPDLRAFYEPRFGQDFSNVRVHTDAKTTQSARSIKALAYTVGNNIVFAAGQYAPQSTKGKKLLAHELTHVVQQHHNSSVQISRLFDSEEELFPSREPAPELFGRPPGSTLPYREATELLKCIEIMGEENAQYCREVVLGEKPPPSPPATCVPNRQLTWADFTGTPSGSYSAFTAYDYSIETNSAGTAIRATFDPGRSFGRAQFKDPTNRTATNCAANISACETFFDGEAAAGRTGGTFNLVTPSAACPAAVRPNPSVVAHSKADCASVLGPECDRVAQLESQRLLRHEQLHMDIACLLAAKGTAVLGTPGIAPAAILAAVRAKDTAIGSSGGLYDTETKHSCDPTKQADWEAEVQKGLPAVTIP